MLKVLTCLGVVVVMHAVLSVAGAEVATSSLLRLETPAAVERWQANEAASVRHVTAGGRGWMEVTFQRYKEGGNKWPAAGCSLSPASLLDANGIGFVLHNPLDHTQMVQVQVSDAKGQGASDLYRLPPKSTARYLTRFTEMSSMVDVSNIVSVSLYRTLPSHDHRFYVAEMFAVRDPAMPTLLRETAATHAALVKAVQRCGRDELLPQDRLQHLRNVAATWHERLQKPETLVGQMVAGREALTAALTEAKSAVLRAQTGRRVIPWAGAVGRQLLPAEAIAEFDEPIERLDITVLNNAYTQGIVRLTNAGTSTVELLATLEGIATSERDAVELWRAGSVLAVDATVVGDALLPLDPAGSVLIAPGETAELWVRVDARHHDWPTGRHEATLKLRDLRDPEASQALPIVLDVPGVRLPDEPPLNVLLWPELFEARSDAVRGLEPEALRNLADYGSKVMTLMPNELPWPRLNEAGELIEPMDFSRFDERVRFYLEHMPDALFLCWVRFDVPDPEGNFELRSGLEPGSSAWRRGMAAWLTGWRSHIREMGLAPGRFVFYLADEPGPDELDRQMLFAPVAREAVPDMPIYTNASELYDDPGKTAAFLANTDIIQPDATLGFERDPTLLATLRSAPDLEAWVYACRTGRRARHVNAHAYYRLQPWFAMREGLKGIGFWAYAAAHGDPDELWNGTAAAGAGATLVYRGRGRLLMSRRWELLREGIDDARLLALLMERDTPDAEALIERGYAEVLAHPGDVAAVDAWRRRAVDVLRQK